MPKKRASSPVSALLRYRRKRAAKAKGKPAKGAGATRRNPALLTKDLPMVVLPAFGAYAATRVLTRLVYTLVQGRFPRLGKHAGAVSGVAAFGATWWGAHRIKALAPYHDALVVGSAIAALQTVGQTYIPKKYSWLLCDYGPADVAKRTAARPAPAVAAPPIEDELDVLIREANTRNGSLGAPPEAMATGSRYVAATDPEDEGPELGDEPPFEGDLDVGDELDQLAEYAN